MALAGLILMSFCRLLLVSFVATCTFSQDYLPLAAGNQWIFRSDRFGQTLTIEIGNTRAFDGLEYYSVTGFSYPGGVRWLRQNDAGAIVEYLTDTKAVRPFLALQSPIGQRFDSNVDSCHRSATVVSRTEKLSLAAAGEFTNALQLRYMDSICADAGVEQDFYLPDIGLVRRVQTSIAGPITFDLAYARINGFITLSQAENSFALHTPSPIVEGSRIFARLTVRNGAVATPLRLFFSSGQRFNFELTEASTGRVVYNWASDKSFLQTTETVLVETEKSWVIDFTVPQPLKAGSYVLEGYLTTGSYRATVPLEVVAPQNAVH